MSKKSLKCEYCNNLIKETDLKCPNCGANCSKVIENYREAKEKEEQEKLDAQRKEAEKMAKKIFGAFGMFSIIPIIMFVVVFIIIISSIIRFQFVSDKETDTSKDEIINIKEEQQKDITVGLKEKAVTKDYDITVTEYELFEYKSDTFADTYNTEEGYQKIAFLVKIDNKTTKAINTNFEFKYSMKADNYKVEEAEYERGMFTYPSPGKDKYPTIKFTSVEANDSLQGYVNFTVPTNAKQLKLKIGKYVTVEMDNPAYKE